MSQQEIFNYYAPKNNYIGILSIPHSGEFIPAEFKNFLSENQADLDCDLDYKVDELVDIDMLTEGGIAVIVSNIHRACVDLNRAEKESVLNWKSNSKGIEIVKSEPTAETKSLLESKYHIPYFEMIKTMINELHKKTTKPITLIDLHSMPSTATEYHLKVTPNQPEKRPHFCISNIKGLSCESQFLDDLELKLRNITTNINQNFPYYGGFITRHIHATFERINNVQIEISREIYMDEVEHVMIPEKAKKLKEELTRYLIEFYIANQ